MNSDLELVLDRERKRYQLLLHLWRVSIGHTNKRVDLKDLGKSLGLTEAECMEVIIYLRNEGLIHGVSLGYTGAISHKGIVEIERTIKHPHQATEHFHVQVIQNFHGTVGAVQNSSNSVANINKVEE